MGEPNVNVNMFEETLQRLEESIDNISRKGYGYYKVSHLDEIHSQMENDNAKAIELYNALVQNSDDDKENAVIVDRINSLFGA